MNNLITCVKMHIRIYVKHLY